jgi:hypothetical protein
VNVFFEALTKIDSVAAILAGGLTSLGILGALVLALTRRGTDLPVKLVGTFLVLGLCFAANNGFVYAAGVFVVATLVTELQFLEKLAAIIWNRKEYWDYLGQASKKDIERKIADESRQIASSDARRDQIESGAGPPKPALPATAQSGFHFHRAVTNALISNPPFPVRRVQHDLKFGRGGRTVLVDAILDTAFGSLFVEIKAGYSERLVDEALRELSKYMELATPLIVGSSAPIGCMIIVPAAEGIPLTWRGVPILQFDTATRTFRNGKEVESYLSSR